MKEKQRCCYLDILKTLAILLVCLYHFPPARGLVYERPFDAGLLAGRFFRAFDSVCVPLFMMVNGALLLNRPLDMKRHAARFLRLLIGMHVWYLVIMIGVHLWRNGASYVAANLKGILLSMMYMYEYDGVTTSLFWFVRMLLAVYAIFPLIKAGFDSEDVQIRRGCRFFLIVMLAVCFAPNDVRHVQGILPGLRNLELSAISEIDPFKELYGEMVVYFLIGGFMHRCYERMISVRYRTCALLIAVGWLALFIEWYLMTIRYDAFYDIVCHAYGCLATLVLCIGVFTAAAKAADRFAVQKSAAAPALRLIGGNTLAVYYLHWLLGYTLMERLPAAQSFAPNLLKNAALVLVCALIGEGIRRIPLLRRLV